MDAATWTIICGIISTIVATLILFLGMRKNLEKQFEKLSKKDKEELISFSKIEKDIALLKEREITHCDKISTLENSVKEYSILATNISNLSIKISNLEKDLNEHKTTNLSQLGKLEISFNTQLAKLEKSFNNSIKELKSSIDEVLLIAVETTKNQATTRSKRKTE
jgi:hypothetical protein